MFNLPEGVGKELDDTDMECTVCRCKEDVDNGVYLNESFGNYGDFVCYDCLKENFVNTEDGYILSENYDDWKTDKLRELVKELREHYQSYFTQDIDVSTMLDKREILKDIEKLDERVYGFVDDAYFFYIPRHNTTLEQLYHVIDYLCGTELEIK